GRSSVLVCASPPSFFSLPARRPHRHSFPTRRSSDLDYVRWFVEHAFVLVPAQSLVAQHLESFKQFPPRQKPGSFSVEQAMEKLRDRKSTRLNSSHLVISYAVFCLKKKNRYSIRQAGARCGGGRRLRRVGHKEPRLRSGSPKDAPRAAPTRLHAREAGNPHARA